MNQLALNFTYTDIQIRTITTALDEIWFVGKDVAVALGHKNPERAIREYVDDEDKGVTDIVTPGGKQQMVIVNEPGVYSLIFASQTEGAKKFKRWVTHEVLPSIRKQGYYSLMSDHELVRLVIEKYKNDPSFLVKLRKPNIDKQIKIDEANRKFTDELLAEVKADALWARSASLSREQYIAELQEICKDAPKVFMSEMIRWNKRRGTNT